MINDKLVDMLMKTTIKRNANFRLKRSFLLLPSQPPTWTNHKSICAFYVISVICVKCSDDINQYTLFQNRVAEVVRRHEGPLPKSLDLDENKNSVSWARSALLHSNAY